VPVVRWSGEDVQLIDTEDQELFYDAMGRLIAAWSGQPTETEAYVWAGPTELVGQGLATGLGNGYGLSEHFVVRRNARAFERAASSNVRSSGP
jgi:hypothetical protein